MAECFLIAPSDRASVALRRYARTEEPACPGRGYHDAETPIGFLPMAIRSESPVYDIEEMLEPDHSDPRWPVKCEHCTYYFAPDDNWQVFTTPMYVAEDGREMSLRDAEVGAIWDGIWLPDNYRVNGSGPCWVVKLPGNHDWIIGSEATNCTRPGEDHDCWCCHGEAPKLTVDKNPEPGRSTCNAGGGSIWVGQGTEHEFHGFLSNGVLA